MVNTESSLREIFFSAFLSFSSHKSFEQEGEEVGEGVKLAIETDVLIAEFNTIFFYKPSCGFP